MSACIVVTLCSKYTRALISQIFFFWSLDSEKQKAERRLLRVGLLTAVTLTAHNLPEGMAVLKAKKSLSSKKKSLATLKKKSLSTPQPARGHGGAKSKKKSLFVVALYWPPHRRHPHSTQPSLLSPSQHTTFPPVTLTAHPHSTQPSLLSGCQGMAVEKKEKKQVYLCSRYTSWLICEDVARARAHTHTHTHTHKHTHTRSRARAHTHTHTHTGGDQHDGVGQAW
jgi:hypothetical protein